MNEPSATSIHDIIAERLRTDPAFARAWARAQADGETVPETVILVCPCCASPVEATPDPCPQAFDCENCEQKWTMIVCRDRLLSHSLAVPTSSKGN